MSRNNLALKFGTLAFALVILCHIAQACTSVEEPFRKTFRAAKAVFLADVIAIKDNDTVDYNESLIDGRISFHITKSWKGNFAGDVTLPGNIGFVCGCRQPDQFRIGTTYIVTVDKKSNAYFCYSVKYDDKHGREIEKKLNSFGFRTWARLYPF